MNLFPINQIENKHIFGRTSTTENGIAFFWGASGIELNVKAKELWMDASVDFEEQEPWLVVFINNALISRFPLTKGKNKICIFRAANPDQVKNVKIFRDTQPIRSDSKHSLEVTGFSTDGSFEKVKPYKMRIEFLGDSITSGEGTVGAPEDNNWQSMLFSATKSFAFKTAQALNADFRVMSCGGHGVVTGYNNDPDMQIPSHYYEVCSLASGARNKKLGALNAYDFKAWKADYVIVNLGTNDQGAFWNPPFMDKENKTIYKMHLTKDGKPEEDDAEYFMCGVIQFLSEIRKNNPKAKIVWLYGMMGRLLLSQIKSAVKQYSKTTGDTDVEFVLMPEVDESRTGSYNHPSEEQQEEACEYLLSKVFTDRKS